MMSGERRAEVINITNTSGEEMDVECRIEDLPGGQNPEYVKVFQVEYVDTREGLVVASALVPIRKINQTYKTRVPVGMTRQIWLSFEPRKMKAGTYRGRVILTSGNLKKKVELELAVAPIQRSNWPPAFSSPPMRVR